MAGESLKEGLEKAADPRMPLHKSVKVKPEMQWRSQDVEEARAMGFLARRAAYSSKERCMLQTAKLEGQRYQRSLKYKFQALVLSL